MRCDELNFKTIVYDGQPLEIARHTFTNGFTVSVIREYNEETDEVGLYNAAIVRDGSMVITEVHAKTKPFIVGSDYTFDLADKRKVTFFLKNVDNLYPGDDYTDVHMDENGQMVIGEKHPASKELLKIIKKITPFNEKEHIEQ